MSEAEVAVEESPKVAVKPMSEKIREYKEANPKATSRQIAVAVGATPHYVQSRLAIEARRARDVKKKKRGRPLKTKWAPPTGTVVLDGEWVQVLTPEQKKTEDAFEAAIKQVQETEEHPLYPVFVRAISQAMYGKGERHGGAKTSFLDQPWTHYAKLHGRGFLTGQAAKKLEEAVSTREGTAFEDELLGAMVYIGMAILHNRGGK